MLEEYLAGLDDLFPIGFIGEKFTLEAFYLFFPDHAFQAIKQEHLALGIDENVFQAVCIAMIQQGFQDQAGPSAKGKGLGEGSRMPGFKQVVADSAFRLAGADKLRAGKLRTGKLGKVYGKETETKHVYGIDAVG